MSGPVDQSGVPSALPQLTGYLLDTQRFVLCSEKAKHRLFVDMLPPSLSLVYSAQIQIWAKAEAPNVLPKIMHPNVCKQYAG